MTKIIRLTESDLTRIVKRVLKEVKEILPDISGNAINTTTGEEQKFKLIGSLSDYGDSIGKKYVYNNYDDSILKTAIGDTTKIEFIVPFTLKNIREDGLGQIKDLKVDNISENETKITLTAEKKKPLVNLIGKRKYDDIEIKISFKKFEKPIVDSGQETKIEESIRRILKKTINKGFY